MNIQKHVKYWRRGAKEEIVVAGDLLDKGHVRQALFFAHLAVEKALKALAPSKRQASRRIVEAKGLVQWLIDV
jgi:HEPN domain-containing protein